MTIAPAVAGIAMKAGTATQTSFSTMPYVVHAMPLIVEFASAAMLTPTAERSRISLLSWGTV